MKKKLTFTLCAMLFSTISLAANIPHYQGWWWNPYLSGTGVNIGQQWDTLVVTWYHFDDAGNGTYLTMSGKLNGNRLEAPLYRTTGPQPGNAYDPAQVNSTAVDTGTIIFHSLIQAELLYTYEGKKGSIELQRFIFKKSPLQHGTGSNYGYGSVYVKNRYCDYTQGTDHYTLTISPEAQAISQHINGYNEYYKNWDVANFEDGYSRIQTSAARSNFFITDGYQLTKNGNPVQLDDPVLASTCYYVFTIHRTEDGLQGVTGDRFDGGIGCNIGPGLLVFSADQYTYLTTTVHQVQATADSITFDYSAKASLYYPDTQGTCEENGTVVLRKYHLLYISD